LKARLTIFSTKKRSINSVHIMHVPDIFVTLYSYTHAPTSNYASTLFNVFHSPRYTTLVMANDNY